MPRKTNFNRPLIQSKFYCVHCGRRGLDIFRKKSKTREAGHLKKIYCVNCKKECNHAEIRQNGNYKYEDFLLEFQYHNFDEEGNRIKPYRQFIHELRQKKGKNNG